MPTPPTWPGTYVGDRPTGPRPIEGVATSITAFIGRTLQGPLDESTSVTSMSEFESHYGGLAVDCPLTYAVQHFFKNGGTDAVIARIVHRDARGDEDPSAPITDADIADPALESTRRGLWLLDHADLVNLICIPPLAPALDVAPSTWNAAIAYAKQRRAFVIVDPPAAWSAVKDAVAGVDQFIARDSHAALYFPRIVAPDPLSDNAPRTFAPSGAVAGLYARTDRARGVWKGPAGTDARLTSVTDLSVSISDRENGLLNPQGINYLRSFPALGHVVWGARTLAGADSLASEWKYVAVRRLALFIEESLDRSLSWAVFEPNGAPLWSQIRGYIGAFLHDLFRQGAFQGPSPLHSYFVKCDRETTTPNDIAEGVVNIMVGIAPLKPAEFVIIRIRQRAGPPPN